MKHLKIVAIILSSLVVVSCSKKEESVPSANYIKPNNFLSNTKYKSLIVEVNYMKGYEPTQQALNNLEELLEERLNKSSGITMTSKEIPAVGKQSYNITDINNIENMYRKTYPALNVLSAYFLFVDGAYYLDENNSKVLGVAHNQTSVAIFEETIQDYSGGVTQPSTSALESAVINHEFGHLLGLVNNGTPMANNHQDSNHGHHCNNSSCLMYYTAETSDIVANLVGNGIPELDSNCIADLKANGGK